MDTVSTLPFTGKKTSRFHATSFRAGRPYPLKSLMDTSEYQQQQQLPADEDDDEFNQAAATDEFALEQNDDVCSEGSFYENDDSAPSDVRDSRPVIGGSILIRNACRLDPTSGSRLVDLVEGGDDPTDTFVVEENANLFDGNYFQTRENPLYSSDQDLSEDRRTMEKGDVNADNSNDFKVTSKTKDWSDTVQVDDVDQSSGGTGSSQYDVASLLADAPLDSIRQKINVERDEQVVQGPLPANEEALLNTDVVSEKVDLDLIAGQVQVTVCVRCERTVPLYSVDSVYKKSSVIVTRRVHIDMDCTDIRRQLYDTLQRRQYDNSSSDSNRLRLSAKETFQLYKGFMGLVEANENARTNFFKPQPGSILSDDIEILKKPPVRPSINGSSPSNRHTDHASRDNHTASESSPFVSSRMPLTREAVTNATLSSSSGLLDNRSSPTEERTSYASRMTSRPDYGTSSFVSSDTEMSNTSMTSPYSVTSSFSSSIRPRHDDILNRSPYGEEGVSSSYSSRYSTESRGEDQRDSRSDHPSTRMSAYEKYRSRSPYTADDRMTSSRTSSNYISSRTTIPDSNVDVPTRPISRYERIMASRSRSPYRIDNGSSTTPFVTRTISLDADGDVASDYVGRDTTTRSTSRFNGLGGEDGSYTSGIMASARRASIGSIGSDADRYPRSTLPARYSGLQHTTSPDVGGSTPSYESRFTPRVSGNDNGTTSDYLSSRMSHIRSASSPFSTSVEVEEHNPYYTSRYGLLSSSRDSSTIDHSDSLNRYTTNDEYVGRNGIREQQYGASMNNHTSPPDMLPSAEELIISSPRTDVATSYSRRMGSEYKLESNNITNSTNGVPEVAVDCMVTSSKPLSKTEDDTLKPVADAIDAAITSLNHVTSPREMNAQSSGYDKARTPRSQSSVISIHEKAASRPDVASLLGNTESPSQIAQSVAVIDSTKPSLPPSASAARVRRSSTSSNPVQASASTASGSNTSSTRPPTASTARRNSSTPSNSAAAEPSTTSRPVPSYASSTSSSSMKTSASSGTTPKPPMSRTNSSTSLRDATVASRPQQRASSTLAGLSSSPSKPLPRAGRGDSTTSETSSTATERHGSALSSSRGGAPSSTERRGSTSSTSKNSTPFSSSTSQRTAAYSASPAAVPEHRRTRNSSGSLSESNRSTSSASVAAPEETPRPVRPVSASRTAPSTPSSGRRTPAAAASAAVTAAASRVGGSRATTSTTTGVAATGSGPPASTSSRPPAAPTSSTARPVNAVRPYRSRNSSTSLNN